MKANVPKSWVDNTNMIECFSSSLVDPWHIISADPEPRIRTSVYRIRMRILNTGKKS